VFSTNQEVEYKYKYYIFIAVGDLTIKGVRAVIPLTRLTPPHVVFVFVFIDLR
jgi:hypothetical protein